MKQKGVKLYYSILLCLDLCYDHFVLHYIKSLAQLFHSAAWPMEDHWLGVSWFATNSEAILQYSVRKQLVLSTNWEININECWRHCLSCLIVFNIIQNVSQMHCLYSLSLKTQAQIVPYYATTGSQMYFGHCVEQHYNNFLAKLQNIFIWISY